MTMYKGWDEVMDLTLESTESPSSSIPQEPSYDPYHRVEFQEHQCWRMLMVWPTEDEAEPAHAICQGCDARYRFEREDPR